MLKTTNHRFLSILQLKNKQEKRDHNSPSSSSSPKSTPTVRGLPDLRRSYGEEEIAEWLPGLRRSYGDLRLSYGEDEIAEWLPGLWRYYGEDEIAEVQEMKRKAQLLNRKKDFVLLILSYPIFIEEKDGYEKWINNVRSVNEDVKITISMFHARNLQRVEIADLSSSIQKLLNYPMDIIDDYIPRDLMENINERLKANTASVVDKKFVESIAKKDLLQVREEIQSRIAPDGITGLAVNLAVQQIQENIDARKFQRIRISGIYNKNVTSDLQYSPRTKAMFSSVVRVSLLHYLSPYRINTWIKDEIAQEMNTQLSSDDRPLLEGGINNVLVHSKILLILCDIDERIDPYEVGISDCGEGVIIFATETHKTFQTMEVDMEVRTEDHLLSWEIFCRNVGEVIYSHLWYAEMIVEECRGHLLVITLMARCLKTVIDHDIWELAVQKLKLPPPPEIKGIDKVMVNALAFVFEIMDDRTKHCIKCCTLYPKREWITKVALISHWIQDGLVDKHEGEYILESLTDTFLVENFMERNCVRVPREIHDVISTLFPNKLENKEGKRDHNSPSSSSSPTSTTTVRGLPDLRRYYGEVEEMKRKAQLLNRKKDFVLLILSYPICIEDKDGYEKWINNVRIVNEDVKITISMLHAGKLQRVEIADLSSRIQKLLSYPMDIIEGYIPRDLIENIIEGLNANTPSVVDTKFVKSITEEIEILQGEKHGLLVREEKKFQLAPVRIISLAVNLAVQQIQKNIDARKFQRIRISGIYNENVTRDLQYSPRMKTMFSSVLCIDLSHHRSNKKAKDEIAREMKIQLSSDDRPLLEGGINNVLVHSKILLILCDIDGRIDPYEVGISDCGEGVIIFATETHKNFQKMEVDMEIRTEDHLISWEIFCMNVGEVIYSQPRYAEMIVEECRGHLLVITLMARCLKTMIDHESWELAVQKLKLPPPPEIKGIDKVMVNALAFILEVMDDITKHCIKCCTLYPKREWINKVALISHWIRGGLVDTQDEGEDILNSLTDAFLLENFMERDSVRVPQEIGDLLVPGEIDDVLVKLLESMKVEWDAKEIHWMDKKLSELPKFLNCPLLIALYLQRNYDLIVIPPLFFEHMPVLQVLDLSHTSIKSLPKSFSTLVALRKLLLRGCKLFMELSPQVGELKNLEELDLDKTQIVDLPAEIGELVNLKQLRVSFYRYMKSGRTGLQSNKVTPGAIASLSQLTELSIDVDPDDEWWVAKVEVVIKEVCRLNKLKTLILYLPKTELLNKLREGSSLSIIHRLSCFKFIVGRHKQQMISQVPHEVEARFKNSDKCLKFVNSEYIPDEIKGVLKYATAFFLDCHATAMNLSQFGMENMKQLKFCLLAECNEMQTIIDGEEFNEEESSTVEDDGTYSEFEYDSDFDEEDILESLRYLSIYYMKNLRSIWNRPTHVRCLSSLKFLGLHSCPNLSTMISSGLLSNLVNLEELIVEDCPQVSSLVSHASSTPTKDFLPSLKRVSLLFLPELVSISNGLRIAPKLEKIGFYNCPNLQNLSSKELSSKNLKVIKGEKKWWENLIWNESEWRGRPDYLYAIFSPIDREKDVMTQLAEDGDFFQASKQE